MTEEELRHVKKTLGMCESIVDLYQQSLDILDLEIDFNLTWPDGRKANARELCVERIKRDREAIDKALEEKE